MEALALELVLDEDTAASDEDATASDGDASNEDTQKQRETNSRKRKKRTVVTRSRKQPARATGGVRKPRPTKDNNRYAKYPVCHGCGETEWHFSSMSPGEPTRRAPVVITYNDCKRCWHMQCVAPGHTPGDSFVFFDDRWTCQRCDLKFKDISPGASPLVPIDHETWGMKFAKTEAIEREWLDTNNEPVALVRFPGGISAWASRSAFKTKLSQKIHA